MRCMVTLMGASCKDLACRTVDRKPAQRLKWTALCFAATTVQPTDLQRATTQSFLVLILTTVGSPAQLMTQPDSTARAERVTCPASILPLPTTHRQRVSPATSPVLSCSRLASVALRRCYEMPVKCRACVYSVSKKCHSIA